MDQNGTVCKCSSLHLLKSVEVGFVTVVVIFIWGLMSLPAVFFYIQTPQVLKQSYIIISVYTVYQPCVVYFHKSYQVDNLEIVYCYDYLTLETTLVLCVQIDYV